MNKPKTQPGGSLKPVGSATLCCEKCNQPIRCMEEMCIGTNLEILCDDCHEQQQDEELENAALMLSQLVPPNR